MNNTMYKVTINGDVIGEVEILSPAQMSRLRSDQEIRVKEYSDRFFDSVIDEYNNIMINALIKSA